MNGRTVAGKTPAIYQIWIHQAIATATAVVVGYFEVLVKLAIFKLVETRSVETGFLRGLRYANVSLTHSHTHSGVDTVCN